VTDRAAYSVVVAALGCEFRRDDGAGAAVLQQVCLDADPAAVLTTIASPIDLLDLWDGAGLAVVVDALGVGHPGTVLDVELDGATFPEAIGVRAPGTSSHGLGVVEALRLAFVRGTAPRRAVLVGIVGEDFAPGVGLTPSVAAAVDRAARRVERVVRCARVHADGTPAS
jgi:hydrogenase maturation protease